MFQRKPRIFFHPTLLVVHPPAALRCSSTWSAGAGRLHKPSSQPASQRVWVRRCERAMQKLLMVLRLLVCLTSHTGPCLGLFCLLLGRLLRHWWPTWGRRWLWPSGSHRGWSSRRPPSAATATSRRRPRTTRPPPATCPLSNCSSTSSGTRKVTFSLVSVMGRIF